jgi:hypothetical protein
MNSHIKMTFAALSLAVASFGTQANVIDSADVSGLKTFQDTNTGRIWLDMNNFFDASANVSTTGYNMINTAQNAGFTFATQSDVEQLLNSLSLGNGEWSSYAPIMGYGIPRQLIWGMFDDTTGNPFGFAWAWSDDIAWNIWADVSDASTIMNENIPGAVDMGLWAYQTGNTNSNVPEATTLASMSLGIAFMGAMRRRKSI